MRLNRTPATETPLMIAISGVFLADMRLIPTLRRAQVQILARQQVCRFGVPIEQARLQRWWSSTSLRGRLPDYCRARPARRAGRVALTTTARDGHRPEHADVSQ